MDMCSRCASTCESPNFRSDKWYCETWPPARFLLCRKGGSSGIALQGAIHSLSCYPSVQLPDLHTSHSTINSHRMYSSSLEYDIHHAGACVFLIAICSCFARWSTTLSSPAFAHRRGGHLPTTFNTPHPNTNTTHHQGQLHRRASSGSQYSPRSIPRLLCSIDRFIACTRSWSQTADRCSCG